MPTMLRPRSAYRIRLSSRDVHPPLSGVPAVRELRIQTARLTSWHIARVHYINVEADDDRSAPYSVLDLLRNPVHPMIVNVESVDQIETCRHVVVQILRALPSQLGHPA